MYNNVIACGGMLRSASKCDGASLRHTNLQIPSGFGAKSASQQGVRYLPRSDHASACTFMQTYTTTPLPPRKYRPPKQSLGSTFKSEVRAGKSVDQSTAVYRAASVVSRIDSVVTPCPHTHQYAACASEQLLDAEPCTIGQLALATRSSSDRGSSWSAW